MLTRFESICKFVCIIDLFSHGEWSVQNTHNNFVVSFSYTFDHIYKACTKTRNNETKRPKRNHRNERNETTETFASPTNPRYDQETFFRILRFLF